MLPVVRTIPAAADLAAILEYLSDLSPAAASRFSIEFTRRCRTLGANPRLGRARDELRAGLRSLVVGDHVVIYRVTDVAIEILRVFFGAQDYAAEFDD